MVFFRSQYGLISKCEYQESMNIIAQVGKQLWQRAVCYILLKRQPCTPLFRTVTSYPVHGKENKTQSIGDEGLAMFQKSKGAISIPIAIFGKYKLSVGYVLFSLMYV